MQAAPRRGTGRPLLTCRPDTTLPRLRPSAGRLQQYLRASRSFSFNCSTVFPEREMQGAEPGIRHRSLSQWNPMEAKAKTILVADDYAGLRGLLRVILEQRGYEVLMAENGVATVELFTRHHPVIVILDLHMPDMKGFDVLTQLHALDPQARIIIHSGRDLDSVRERAFSLGASAVFQKGCSLTKLADFLEDPAPTAGTPV